MYNEEGENLNFFPKPYDNVVKLEIFVSNDSFNYYISQRENFYLTNDFKKINIPVER